MHQAAKTARARYKDVNNVANHSTGVRRIWNGRIELQCCQKCPGASKSRNVLDLIRSYTIWSRAYCSYHLIKIYHLIKAVPSMIHKLRELFTVPSYRHTARDREDPWLSRCTSHSKIENHELRIEGVNNKRVTCTEALIWWPSFYFHLFTQGYERRALPDANGQQNTR